MNGVKFEISFEEHRLSIKNSSGKSQEYEYSQNSVKMENSVKTYGIKLGDGRAYQIVFPSANDASKGIISLENNQPLYTISRTSYIFYNDLYKLSD